MRKLVLTLLSSCLWIASFGQWIPQNTGTTDQLYSVFFPDSNTGYAVGWNGAMVKTVDAGSSWTTLTSGTSQALLSVYFTSTTTGYAVGNGGLILKTIDGGNTWSSQTVGSANLTSVRFTDANNGIAVGDSGTIIVTSDAGTTWTTQTSGTNYQLNSTFFLSNTNGYAAGAYGTVLKYNGSTWFSMATATNEYLYSVFFVNVSIGYAVGLNGTIIKTTDGGAMWNPLSSGTSLQLSSVYFTDPNTGYVLGLNGLILKTTDGGFTWNTQVSNTSDNLWSVYFTNSATGYIADGGGNILKTTTAGNCPVSVSVNATNVTCNGFSDGTAKANVSCGTPPYTYLWSPGGQTTDSISGLSAGIFTVTVTDNLGGYANYNYTITEPSALGVTTSSTDALCFGSWDGTATATAAGGVPPYSYSFFGGNASVISGVNAGNYPVYVNDSNGCTASDTAIINQPSQIVITPVATQTICPGASAVISATVSGGTPPYIYDWSSDAVSISNQSSVTVAPLNNTGYMVAVTDNNSCFGTATTYIIVAPATNISGHISYSGGALSSGVNTVALYEYVPSGTTLNAVQTTNVDGLGDYYFANVNQGNYLVKAFNDTTFYPNLIPTYFDGEYLWDNAAPVSHTCDSNTVINISMIEAPVLSGTGSISGTIVESSGFVRVPGDPIPGVDVKLGRNPGGQLVVSTQTDANGEYSFDNVPVNALGESYTIYVDIPGLERDSTYTVVITSSELDFPNLNYTADSSTVTPDLSGATGIYGHVSYSGGSLSSGNNTVVLFEYLPQSSSSFNAVQTTTIDSSGNYYFPSVNMGDYLVKALNDDAAYPNLIPTYHSGAFLWDDATVLSHNWISNDTVNITMLEVPAISGPGSISGTIREADGFRAIGDPVSGAQVILELQPSAQLVANAVTNNNGAYSFSNLPVNNPGDYYKLYVDIPGLDRDSTYTVMITAGVTDFSYLDYTADSVSVTPDLTAVGIASMTAKENKIYAFPNPTTGLINIHFTNEITSETIHLSDLSGRVVYTKRKSYMQAGSILQLNLKDLGVSPGTYVLDLTGSGTKYKIIFIQD
jgi:photosystem II stability/assembly factor-like uncharacterized protein